jgi:hypothetical protein
LAEVIAQYVDDGDGEVVNIEHQIRRYFIIKEIGALFVSPSGRTDGETKETP